MAHTIIFVLITRPYPTILVVFPLYLPVTNSTNILFIEKQCGMWLLGYLSLKVQIDSNKQLLDTPNLHSSFFNETQEQSLQIINYWSSFGSSHLFLLKHTFGRNYKKSEYMQLLVDLQYMFDLKCYYLRL